MGKLSLHCLEIPQEIPFDSPFNQKFESDNSKKSENLI